MVVSYARIVVDEAPTLQFGESGDTNVPKRLDNSNVS